MEKEKIINLIEPTPKLFTKKCRFIAFLIQISLEYAPIIAGLLAWYMYDYFIGGASFLLGYIIIGIVRSKLRNSVIPITQREYPYTDKAIATWYAAKMLCYEQNSAEDKHLLTP